MVNHSWVIDGYLLNLFLAVNNITVGPGSWNLWTYSRYRIHSVFTKQKDKAEGYKLRLLLKRSVKIVFVFGLKVKERRIAEEINDS